jgi:hypothetical protein
MGVLSFVVAIAIALIIWKTSTYVIRMLSAPPPEVDPEDVVEVDQDFRCSICGAEVTMRAVNLAEMVPPKHCREEMDAVWRP